jgi:hypothetical protein
MPRPYIPIPTWLTAADLLAIILIPLWAIGSGVIRALMRIDPPPRARFIVARDRFEMELVAHDSGERTTVRCDPKQIVELRKNRFDKGLWIHIRGKSMDTYLQDVDDETIHAICSELHKIMAVDGMHEQGENTIDPDGARCKTANNTAVNVRTGNGLKTSGGGSRQGSS